MAGIDPSLNKLSSDYLEKVFREFPKRLLEHLNLLDNVELKQGLLNAGQEVFKNYGSSSISL